MDKEDLLAEFDGIKATVHIIDKRKGEVATSCLEKELDLVKDIIAVIEKALKLRVLALSQMFAIKFLHPKPMTTQGSVGFDNMLDPGCKDELAADNDQEGLVKLVGCKDEKVVDEKVKDEKVVDEKVVDENGQASPHLTAKEVQQPPSKVCVDVHVDHVLLINLF
ncbi:hypothetical protein Tco_0909865 [Tanacetum coccineum]|uniref:Uncharacterized protein n=1 Tax=Tanacetum coccineum TaxID=301880 RepID=A0ABQ5CSH6_9ASTR